MIATAAMTDGGGIAVTVRRDMRSPGRWGIHGPDARRIGVVCPVGGSTPDWWAEGRDGAIQGRAATFGAAVGMVVDAAIGVDTRRLQPADGCTDDDAPGRFLRLRLEYAAATKPPRRQRADGRTDDEAPGHLPPPRLVRPPRRRRDHREGDDR